MDIITPGMKELLEVVHAAEDVAFEDWVKQQDARSGASFIKEKQQKLYRILMEHTEGAALTFGLASIGKIF